MVVDCFVIDLMLICIEFPHGFNSIPKNYNNLKNRKKMYKKDENRCVRRLEERISLLLILLPPNTN